MVSKQTAAAADPSVKVDRNTLIRVWSLLELLACSSQRIGSAHAVPTKADFTPEREREYLLELGRFVDQRVLEDANELRVLLGEHLSDDEAEQLSEQINHWEPSKK